MVKLKGRNHSSYAVLFFERMVVCFSQVQYQMAAKNSRYKYRKSYSNVGHVDRETVGTDCNNEAHRQGTGNGLARVN